MIRNSAERELDILCERYPALLSCREDILNAFIIMRDAYNNGGKLLIAGNGGSASDSEHFAGELMKSFRLKRPISDELIEQLQRIDPDRGGRLADKLESPLTAVPLVANEAMTTAFINDVGAEGMFAQKVLGFGSAGDVLVGITTSGNSENIIDAAIVAKTMGIKVIGLTGRTGGIMNSYSDICVKVPETETYKIQEYHLPVYHAWCLMLEEEFFGAEE